MSQFWVESAADNVVTYDEDATLTDSMSDSYVTAVDENATQYLSVLDSTAGGSDLTLDCLNNLSLNTSKIDSLQLQDDPEPIATVSEENNADLAGQDVVVFSREGSDDLFGIQTTQDEDGNIYRYQFQFRTNEDGQLEAIPETIQLLADVQEEQEVETIANVNLKIEKAYDEENYVDNADRIEITAEDEYNDQIDSKQAILQSLQQQTELKTDSIQSSNPIYPEYKEAENLYAEAAANATSEEEDTDNQHYENIFVEENYITSTNDPEEGSTADEETPNEPDEVPEVENEHFPEVETILHESTATKSNVLTVDNNNGTEKSPLQIYYVMQQQNQAPNQMQRCEKENLIRSFRNLKTASSVAPNPRSLLKVAKPIEVKPNRQVLANNSVIRRDDISSSLLEKRFARSKEAIQARQFQNFINRTTILQPPVRQQRQPRKQIIQPVKNRDDEEIIVKEVMVSSEGFVEDLSKTKNAKCIEFIELSDDDDDKDDAENQKDKENDSDSEISIIEIDSDGEKPKRGRGRPRKEEKDDSTSKESSGGSIIKRRRGRPSKSSVLDETSPKKSRTDEDDDLDPKEDKEKDPEPKEVQKEIVLTVEKKEIKCPHCIKTFPSENSLSTHIQHHNLENSLRSQRPRIEFKHRCSKCQTVFKNTILLQRHHCPGNVAGDTKKEKQNPSEKPSNLNKDSQINKLSTSEKSDKASLTCNVCEKAFSTPDLLHVHKKVHIKQNLVKSTTAAVVKVSPRKSKFIKPPPPPPLTKKTRPTRSSTIIPQIITPNDLPKKITRQSTTNANFRCKDCKLIFSTQTNLTAHQKIHKKFTCATCKQSFPSRILLDTHLRGSCVKPKSPRNRRLSLTVRKSIIQSPKLGKRTPVRKSTLMIPCDMCSKKFPLFEAMLKHKVLAHNFSTPDKSFLSTSTSDRKSNRKNCGIPANKRIAQAQMRIRQNLIKALSANEQTTSKK